MNYPKIDKQKILSSLMQFPSTILQDVLTLSRSLPSPSSLVSAPTCPTASDPLRGAAAPPPDTSYPRLAKTCYKEYNIGNRGLNMDLDHEDEVEGVRYRRCYSRKPRPSDMTVRGILGPKSKDCRCQHISDSAYDSSSNCSSSFDSSSDCSSDDDRADCIREDQDDQFDWGEEEEDEEYTPSASDLRKLAELTPSILFAPHAETKVREDKRRVELHKINLKWNEFYSNTTSCIYSSSSSCRMCKKSVKLRDSKPRVFTFITAF